MSLLIVSNRFRCANLFDNLNIEISPSHLIIMWNKYQIFVYEGSFKYPVKSFTPEYRVHRLLVTEDSFLCLDTNGFVHVSDLCKNDDQQLLLHQPKAQGIKACVLYSQGECLSLKYDSDSYYLSVNKINSVYEELKQIKINAKGPWPLQDGAKDKYILAHKKIDELCTGVLQKIFNTDSFNTNSHFVAISFDKHIIYGCIFDLKGNEEKIELVKIYACSSEICNIEIVGTENSYMLIGLRMGTVIKLSLKDLYNSPGSFPTSITTEVIHLNSALHKFVVTNETIIYTDGTTMWRANNIYSEDITFKQFYVKNVKDFILHDESSIICTTFTKMIYTFPLHAETSYLKSDSKEYTSAEDMLKNSKYLKKIFLEVEKSKKLAKQQSIEGTYIAAMALSKRQEIMDKAISVSVTVCGSFEEVLKENKEELTLPEDLSRYIEPFVFLFLIKMKIDKNAPGLSNIISDIIANSSTEIHITLSNDTKILKTVSVQINKLYILIPHHLENDTEINVNIRVVARIPGAFNEEQQIWTEIYRKEMKMTAEHFIRAAFHKSLFCMKGWVEDFDKAILQCTNMNRKEFTFVNASAPYVAHTMFLRLPKTFKTSDFSKYFSKIKSQFMIDMLCMDEFLMSKNEIGFLVGRHAVEIDLEKDEITTPRLKIVSGSLKVTASIRNFFSNIIYGENVCFPGKHFINLSFYTTVENLQKAVKECIAKSASYKELEPLMEKFESDIIGVLPI